MEGGRGEDGRERGGSEDGMDGWRERGRWEGGRGEGRMEGWKHQTFIVNFSFPNVVFCVYKANTASDPSVSGVLQRRE